MSLDTILAELRTEKAQKLKRLTELEEEIKMVKLRVDQLDAAMANIEGREAPKPESRERSEILPWYRKAVERFNRGDVFDMRTLGAIAAKLAGGSEKRFKQNRFHALKVLEKENVIRRCPGGVCRV